MAANVTKQTALAELKAYRNTYPLKMLKLKDGKKLPFRFYDNPDCKTTVVLLPSGTGFSDLYYLFFDRLVKKFSVLTCDYSLDFKSMDEFVYGLSSLLRTVGRKGWLVGQTLGGNMAELMAKEHPDQVEGMVFIDCCGMTADHGSPAYEALSKLWGNNRALEGVLSITPAPIVKATLKAKVMAGATGLTEAQHGLFDVVCNEMVDDLDKASMKHLIELIDDTAEHMDMKPGDFDAWKGKCLVFITGDSTFPDVCKESLVSILPDPKVVRLDNPGTLTCFVQPDDYVGTIAAFIESAEGAPEE